jgi:hypothetical protein
MCFRYHFSYKEARGQSDDRDDNRNQSCNHFLSILFISPVRRLNSFASNGCLPIATNPTLKMRKAEHPLGSKVPCKARPDRSNM